MSISKFKPLIQTMLNINRITRAQAKAISFFDKSDKVSIVRLEEREDVHIFLSRLHLYDWFNLNVLGVHGIPRGKGYYLHYQVTMVDKTKQVHVYNANREKTCVVSFNSLSPAIVRLHPSYENWVAVLHRGDADNEERFKHTLVSEFLEDYS